MEMSLGRKPARNSCTRWLICIVKGMQCLLYKFFVCIVQGVKLYCIMYLMFIIQAVQQDFCIKHLEEKDDLLSYLIYLTK